MSVLQGQEPVEPVRYAPIRNKAQMYRLLVSGALGNHVPQYFSLAEWARERIDWPVWGVRSMKPSGVFAANLTAGMFGNTAFKGETNMS